MDAPFVILGFFTARNAIFPFVISALMDILRKWITLQDVSIVRNIHVKTARVRMFALSVEMGTF
jgi:hypothetical protein